MLSPDVDLRSTWTGVTEDAAYRPDVSDRLPQLAGVEPWYSLSGAATVDKLDGRAPVVSEATLEEIRVLRAAVSKAGITQRAVMRTLGLRNTESVRGRWEGRYKWRPGEIEAVWQLVRGG